MSDCNSLRTENLRSATNNLLTHIIGNFGRNTKMSLEKRKKNSETKNGCFLIFLKLNLVSGCFNSKGGRKTYNLDSLKLGKSIIRLPT
jgi:hypothetical protein